MCIRQAAEPDVSRIGEILVFNNRTNYLPIFRDERYSFGEMQVLPVARDYLADRERLHRTFVYDDGIVRGFVTVSAGEIQKLYVDTFFQSRGIGGALLSYAVETLSGRFLWVLEKNVRAVAFYRREGFVPTGERVPEEGTTELLLKMTRKGTP